jgi:hypothetical protein
MVPFDFACGFLCTLVYRNERFGKLIHVLEQCLDAVLDVSVLGRGMRIGRGGSGTVFLSHARKEQVLAGSRNRAE